MHSKHTIVAFVAVAVLITGALVMTGERRASEGGVAATTAIPRIAEEGSAIMEGDTQYVDITARAGYSPRVTKAKAGIPTVIRMTAENAYDCSTSVVIPAFGYQTFLKPSATEEIPVPAEFTQGTLRGACSMGMYRFEVVFK